jgi:predicted nucleotidyltransferase
MGRLREAVMAHSREIKDLGSARHARDIRVFGSVARDEDGPDSDVDFLVEFEPGASILDQVHLEPDLQALLGCDVDVVPLGGLKPRDAHLLAEANPL